tara:strand:- start:1060 stop:1341 length:282 start_codon:yes stop_codon:yes gene_type:complete
MIPASFAPMLLRMILGKKIFPALIEKIADKLAKMYKLPQSLDYMELPNSADRLGEKNEEHIELLANNMSDIESRLKKLEILNGKDKKLKKNAK